MIGIVCSESLTLWAPWTTAHQTPLSMKFSRQEYHRGLPFPTPGNLLHPEIEPKSLELPALQADSFPLSYVGSPLLSVTVI